METSLNLLITSKDNQTLHDLSHLVPRLYRKWIKLNPSIPDSIKGQHFSFFRDLETFMRLVKELGAEDGRTKGSDSQTR